MGHCHTDRDRDRTAAATIQSLQQKLNNALRKLERGNQQPAGQQRQRTPQHEQSYRPQQRQQQQQQQQQQDQQQQQQQQQQRYNTKQKVQPLPVAHDRSSQQPPRQQRNTVIYPGTSGIWSTVVCLRSQRVIRTADGQIGQQSATTTAVAISEATNSLNSRCEREGIQTVVGFLRSRWCDQPTATAGTSEGSSAQIVRRGSRLPARIGLVVGDGWEPPHFAITPPTEYDPPIPYYLTATEHRHDPFDIASVMTTINNRVNLEDKSAKRVAWMMPTSECGTFRDALSRGEIPWNLFASLAVQYLERSDLTTVYLAKTVPATASTGTLPLWVCPANMAVIQPYTRGIRIYRLPDTTTVVVFKLERGEPTRYDCEDCLSGAMYSPFQNLTFVVSTTAKGLQGIDDAGRVAQVGLAGFDSPHPFYLCAFENQDVARAALLRQVDFPEWVDQGNEEQDFEEFAESDPVFAVPMTEFTQAERTLVLRPPPDTLRGDGLAASWQTKRMAERAGVPVKWALPLADGKVLVHLADGTRQLPATSPSRCTTADGRCSPGTATRSFRWTTRQHGSAPPASTQCGVRGCRTSRRRTFGCVSTNVHSHRQS